MDDEILEEGMAEDEVAEALDEEEEAVADAEEDDAGGEAGPMDLAEAFGRINAAKQEGADPDVGDGDEGPGQDGGPGPGDDEPLDARDDAADGGPADGWGEDAYSARGQQIARQVQQEAVRMAAKEMSDQGVRPIDVSDIYERTEDGRVVYHNPDDKSRPFASRMEAQQWCDSLNRQISGELKKRARAKQRELARQVMPAVRLLSFAPQFEAMSEAEREIMDELLEGREVRNSRGETVGFDADLDSVAEKARRLAAKYARNEARRAGGRQPQRRSKAPQSPAMDMPGRGSQPKSRAGSEEPQTLEDAFRLLHEQKDKKD